MNKQFQSKFVTSVKPNYGLWLKPETDLSIDWGISLVPSARLLFGAPNKSNIYIESEHSFLLSALQHNTSAPNID